MADVKSAIAGLPQAAREKISEYLGGKKLAYVKADAGKPVMMADDPTKVNGAKLYNQVVHQLSGWYIFTGNKIIYLFQKKSDKAVFELTVFKPSIPLHICGNSGNQWVPEFYTEQNTLKKTGCRKLVWSTNDAAFAATAVAGG